MHSLTLRHPQVKQRILAIFGNLAFTCQRIILEKLTIYDKSGYDVIDGMYLTEIICDLNIHGLVDPSVEEGGTRFEQHMEVRAATVTPCRHGGGGRKTVWHIQNDRRWRVRYVEPAVNTATTSCVRAGLAMSRPPGHHPRLAVLTQPAGRWTRHGWFKAMRHPPAPAL